MAPVKIYALVAKLPEISDEVFHRYWSQEHPKVWLNIAAAKAKIISYSQFHVDKRATGSLMAMGVPLGHHDGVAIMEAESLEAFLSVYQDKEFLEVVLPDEKKFFDRDNSFVLFGHQEDKKVGGKVLVDLSEVSADNSAAATSPSYR